MVILPVTVSQTAELFDQEAAEGRSHFSAVYRVFGHSTHPYVDVI